MKEALDPSQTWFSFTSSVSPELLLSLLAALLALHPCRINLTLLATKMKAT